MIYGDFNAQCTLDAKPYIIHKMQCKCLASGPVCTLTEKSDVEQIEIFCLMALALVVLSKNFYET